MGSEVKFSFFVWLLTIENMILCQKLLDSGLEILPHSIPTHRHLCLDMFEGGGLKI